ncbi:MAG: LysM peptidoglycan-binding domain-containing protein [Bdellovibrionales bacterium]|nr:LysM peptidoglycan-binding domain-containing protein [Bdellovibrionales bacterium]
MMVSCIHFDRSQNKGTDVTSTNSSVPSTDPANTTTSTAESLHEEGRKELQSFHLNEDVSDSQVVAEFENVPAEVNPMVDKWINYFKGKGRPHMERYLARSTRYEKLMKRVLRDNALPEDLFYIALIESGFSSHATSHASAVGYWQFIRGTGKRYGLEISRFVDERRDPVVATQAAADYFRELYKIFGSWYLAMASYNVGEGKVKRETIRNDTRDFWEIAKKRRLPRETINYIPKYIAARMIAKNPDKYGFDGIDYLPPIEFDSIELLTPVNLRLMAEKMNYNYEDLKALNPKFKGEVAPLSNSKLQLRVPVGMLETAKVAAVEAKVDKVEFIADSDETRVYRIRRGDSLWTIARKFRTTIAYLRDLNDLQRRKKLRIGYRLWVPDRTPMLLKRKSIARSKSAKKAEATSYIDGVTKYYIVQNGDSLFSIAQKYNTTVNELKKINRIRRGRFLKIGVKLRLPAQADDKNEKATEGSAKNTFRRKSKPRYHVVKRGDNLRKISLKYDVSFDKLKRKNRIKNPSKILVGSRLVLPN